MSLLLPVRDQEVNIDSCYCTSLVNPLILLNGSQLTFPTNKDDYRISNRSVSSSSRWLIGGTGRVPSRRVQATTPTTLQSQLLSLESARRADAVALATIFSSERAKVSELQPNHLALSQLRKSAKGKKRGRMRRR